MKVTVLSAPLLAKSGVYRSTVELVDAARRAGLDWHAVIGLRHPLEPERPSRAVREVPFGRRKAPQRLLRIIRLLTRYPSLRDADVVVSMHPLSDLALALHSRRPWVAWVRGLPWPAPGEEREPVRLFWTAVERFALSRATEVWATTEVLAAQIVEHSSRRPLIVPAGIALPASPAGPPAGGHLVWAGRYDPDKNAELMLRIGRDLEPTGARIVMHGIGRLEESLRAAAPANVEVAGWAGGDALWADAGIFVGTAFREAFGRSAVEAASRGLPVVIGNGYGCAPLLYRDPALAARFILPIDDPDRWTEAVRALRTDVDLRTRVIAHLLESTRALTIEHSVERAEEQLARAFG